MEKSKASTAIKVVRIVASIVSLGISIAICIWSLKQFGIIGGDTNKNNPPMHERLSQVKNVNYDEKTSLLTWDAVEHANMYTVDVNGTKNNVETNYYTFMPTSKVSNINVQAVDTTGEYDISKWSDTFTYTIPEDTITTQKVFSFVNSFDSSSNLVSIGSMYIEEGRLYSVCHVVDFYKKDRVMYYKTNFKSVINSLTEAMNVDILRIGIVSDEAYSNYDSARYFIESNEYTGKMEEYRQQGYNFEVVSNVVADEGIQNPTVYGTYRLTKDGEVKYVESSVEFAIYNPSTIQSVNYTSKLKNPSDRSAYEIECHELTGDLYDWANMTYESNQSKTNTNTQTSVQSSGMEMDL